MNPNPYRVLFVCTGNSARSILAEAMLNHLGRGRFLAYSAGSQPTGRVNPQALRQLERAGIAVDGYRSKSWDEFSGDAAPQLDLVITVCDSAAQETCPIFLGDFVRTHWGLPDPAAVKGTQGEIEQAFADAHRVIRYRIEQLLALPVEQLDSATLRNRLDAISESSP
ncbi:MAG TPA: arsenate reductase ArsC [Rudaea sp.]|uniref:arsenate reductase ArsC n=1 Tax=Rudaea sp. TaxID=2136325 RepID=UPI002F93622F